jgi:hypothetical protein
MRCTIQVWTTARGNTEVMASGKPLSPSTTAIKMSWVPRLRSSVITRSQNFAPSVCSIQSPRISLWPEQRTPIARYTARLLTMPSLRIFTRSASKNTMA